MRAVVVIIAALVAASVAGGAAAGARATHKIAAGNARFEQGGASRLFRFSATQTKGRSATGWATIDYVPGPRVLVQVSCLWVSGNRALVAGKVSAATVRRQVGRTAVFIVEDGGAPSRDLFTFVYIAESGDEPYSCRNYPSNMVLLKPKQGVVRIGISTA